MARHNIILTLHILGQGGTDRVCIHLANGFVAAGFDVELLVFCRGGEAETELLRLLHRDVKLSSLGPRIATRALNVICYLPAYIRHLRAARPDCVISTGNSMNWITAFGLKLSGLARCRLVMKTTNPIIRPTDNWLKRAFRTAGYRRAFAATDAVWALSDAETRELRARFPRAADKFRTVINPYVTAAMFGGGERAQGDDRAPLVIAAGRLVPQKRLALLIQAFALVRHPGARLVILGDGPERPLLENLVERLNLAGRVTLPGFCVDVADWYARARLLVLPSIYEGLPAVVLEAMAANCPVLTTDCFPLARQLIDAAAGCAIIDPPEALALAALIDESLARERPTSLREIAAGYSIERGMTSHATALQQLLPIPHFRRTAAHGRIPEPAS